ncbi:MAG TPA: hypothetical protein VFF06_10290 [Polyangia bacterium]|nr:hypothetical protein [Polyangia bacterium]
MRRFVPLAAFAALALALSAQAAPHHPPGIRPRVECAKDRDCATDQRCLRGADGKSTCKIACNLDKPVCPEDHRCVKDGPRTVCKPISDLGGL